MEKLRIPDGNTTVTNLLSGSFQVNGIWREAVLWKILLTCISILFSSRKVASCLELGHVAKMSSKILISSILGFGSKTDVGQETQVNIRAGR